MGILDCRGSGSVSRVLAVKRHSKKNSLWANQEFFRFWCRSLHRYAVVQSCKQMSYFVYLMVISGWVAAETIATSRPHQIMRIVPMFYTHDLGRGNETIRMILVILM